MGNKYECKDIVDRINLLIGDSGLSVKAFTDKCNLDRRRLYDDTVSLLTVVKISTAFKVNLNWLILGTGNRYINEVKSWEYGYDYGGDPLYICPACNETFYLECGSPTDNNYHYCPACGVRLKEDNNENISR